MTNVSMTVNGKSVSRDVPDTTLLSDYSCANTCA
jgi:aerobic-type carbon monoxide dehydrogenase small subunit (CoxS/CutS family)